MTTNRSHPGNPQVAPEAFAGATQILPFETAGARVTVRRAQDQTEAILRRLIHDGFASGMACTWRRTADRLEWCRPRPGDYNGRATAAELAARDARLAADAARCRSHARLLEEGAGADLRAELAAMLAAEGVA